jgi:lactate dehydrogenase-like 2-hydroxyacid dehydrogenase
MGKASAAIDNFILMSDKDGKDSVCERELPDTDGVISQAFWPAYLSAERIAKAKKLKLALTAGIGSDHVDLEADIKHGVTVAKVCDVVTLGMQPALARSLRVGSKAVRSERSISSSKAVTWPVPVQNPTPFGTKLMFQRAYALEKLP